MRFSFRARARGQARIYQAQQQNFPGSHHHKHDHDYDETGINGLFLGRGPGRVLVAVGMVVAGCGFAGWASIVFGMWRAQGPPAAGAGNDGFAAVLGPMLPSGVQVGVVYFLGFGVGVILMKIGGSMAKAGAQGASVLGHLVATVVIIGVVVVGIVAVLDGAPLSALQPRLR